MEEKQRLIEAHQPHWGSAWFWLALLGAFFTLQGLLAWMLFAGLTHGSPWGWGLIAFLELSLGHIMHVHLLAFHESSHETLCPQRGFNDGFGILIGVYGFMSLSLYRAAHHSHHAYLSTERDEELWPFVVPGTSRGFRCLAAALELSLGLFYTPFLFLRSFLRSGSPIQAPSARRRIWLELTLLVGVWSVVLAATTWFQAWSIFLAVYLVPALLAGNMQSLRKYIEHMGMTGATVLGCTRSIVPTSTAGRWLARSLFNVPYHGVHHKYARMHASAVPNFTSVLEPACAEEPRPFPSYRHACLDMLASLANPRIGAQWRGSGLL